MCGIAGKIVWDNGEPPSTALLTAMLGYLSHRGPDQYGVYLSEHVGLACARLSIIDLEGGLQPIHNEDRSVWVVCNGEIYNYLELRKDLEALGHVFYTHSDTEVIVHLYEEEGTDFVGRLNGEFAIALRDERREELLLVRDRLGIRPLFYCVSNHGLWFASEVKALLADPSVSLSIDRQALLQVLTFWATLTPRSIFAGIASVAPGTMLRVRSGSVRSERYWALPFDEAESLSMDDAVEQLRALLTESVLLRLRADVPVGAYLSGGLDSSTVAALVSRHAPRRLRTFGIGFADPAYDESEHQSEMTAFLGTAHTQMLCSQDDVAGALGDVVWHAEMPLMRTSPVPMYLLSGLVQQEGYRVVLTGEGADEILGGYGIFREAAVRRFWARDPQSCLRPRLLRQLYLYIGGLQESHEGWLRAFFGQHLSDVQDPLYSHRLRWHGATRGRRLLTAEFGQEMGDYDPLEELVSTLPSEFRRWKPLAQAQYLEMAIFLSEYLLSSQGDRMTAAHSVEGRYPFLDHRLVEFCGRLPARFKLCGLHEKRVLKRAAVGLVPASTLVRPKQPYRAPVQGALRGAIASGQWDQWLGPGPLRDAGLFDPETAARLLDKCAVGADLGEPDEMALVGMVSTQMLFSQFVSQPRRVDAVPLSRVHIVDRRLDDGLRMTSGVRTQCSPRGG